MRVSFKCHRPIRRALSTVAVAASFLLPVPALAYRTAADLKGFPNDARVAWNSSHIAMAMHEAGAPGLRIMDTEAEVRMALSAWAEPMCTGLRMRLSGRSSQPAAPDDHRNTIQWLRSGWSARGFDALAAGITDIAYRRRSGRQWAIVEADTYLNAEHHTWSLRNGTGRDARDVRSVLTHEAGHVLGLLHPCEPDGTDGAPRCDGSTSFTDAMMYPIYRGPEQFGLGVDDEAGLCFLYPESGCRATGCPDGKKCTASGCVNACSTIACPMGETCRAGACVPAAASCTAPECCQRDTDCGAGLRCREGTCEPGKAAVGDVCATDGECAHGLCSDRGYCTRRCAVEEECPAPLTCRKTGSGKACLADVEPIGEPCSHANQCAGGQCLSVGSARPVCTRDCGNKLAPCPVSWTCTSIGSRSVCAHHSRIRSGCSVASDARSGFSCWSIACLLAVAARFSQRSEVHRTQRWTRGKKT